MQGVEVLHQGTAEQQGRHQSSSGKEQGASGKDFLVFDSGWTRYQQRRYGAWSAGATTSVIPCERWVPCRQVSHNARLFMFIKHVSMFYLNQCCRFGF
jgi:hypothetical protein